MISSKHNLCRQQKLIWDETKFVCCVLSLFFPEKRNFSIQIFFSRFWNSETSFCGNAHSNDLLNLSKTIFFGWNIKWDMLHFSYIFHLQGDQEATLTIIFWNFFFVRGHFVDFNKRSQGHYFYLKFQVSWVAS